MAEALPHQQHPHPQPPQAQPMVMVMPANQPQTQQQLQTVMLTHQQHQQQQQYQQQQQLNPAAQVQREQYEMLKLQRCCCGCDLRSGFYALMVFLFVMECLGLVGHVVSLNVVGLIIGGICAGIYFNAMKHHKTKPSAVRYATVLMWIKTVLGFVASVILVVVGIVLMNQHNNSNNSHDDDGGYHHGGHHHSTPTSTDDDKWSTSERVEVDEEGEQFLMALGVGLFVAGVVVFVASLLSLYFTKMCSKYLKMLTLEVALGLTPSQATLPPPPSQQQQQQPMAPMAAYPAAHQHYVMQPTAHMVPRAVAVAAPSTGPVPQAMPVHQHQPTAPQQAVYAQRSGVEMVNLPLLRAQEQAAVQAQTITQHQQAVVAAPVADPGLPPTKY